MGSPIVTTAYNGGFLEYLNLVSSIMFLIWHPISLLIVHRAYSEITWITATWMLTLFILPVYSIVLTIANETLQIYLLYIVHYVQGVIQAYFIINAIMWLLTQWFWIESVQLDEDRSKFGTTARDLQMWQVLTTLPQMSFLAIFYLMLVDIDAFYTKNPSSVAPAFVFIFSTYSKGLADLIDQYL